MDFDTIKMDMFLENELVPGEEKTVQALASAKKAAGAGAKDVKSRGFARNIFSSIPNEDRIKFLQNYLKLFINSSTSNTFVLKPLENNNENKLVMVQNLYQIAVLEKGYEIRMNLINLLMEKLHYDLVLDDYEDYQSLINGLLNNRQPIVEIGNFGSMAQFLQREGSFFLESKDSGYVINLSRYTKYAVRENYEKYGCIANINTKFEITDIDGIRSSDPAFAKKAAIFRSTLVLDIILKCHAIFCHLLVSQKLYLAVTTKYYDIIKDDPILNEFYYLITYRTNDINSKVPVLAGNSGSLIQMGFGFTPDAFLSMMTELYQTPELHTQAGIKDFLINKRCLQWKKMATPVYAAVEKFVDSILADKVPGDLKEQTKLSVFVSTFYHEMIGDYQLKTIYNCDLNSRTYTGEKFDRRTEEFAYIIAASTIGVSVRILKLKELICGTFLPESHLVPWTTFYNDLKGALAPYPWINVDNFEFSVGY